MDSLRTPEKNYIAYRKKANKRPKELRHAKRALERQLTQEQLNVQYIPDPVEVRQNNAE